MPDIDPTTPPSAAATASAWRAAAPCSTPPSPSSATRASTARPSTRSPSGPSSARARSTTTSPAARTSSTSRSSRTSCSAACSASSPSAFPASVPLRSPAERPRRLLRLRRGHARPLRDAPRASFMLFMKDGHRKMRRPRAGRALRRAASTASSTPSPAPIEAAMAAGALRRAARAPGRPPAHGQRPRPPHGDVRARRALPDGPPLPFETPAASASFITTVLFDGLLADPA